MSKWFRKEQIKKLGLLRLFLPMLIEFILKSSAEVERLAIWRIAKITYLVGDYQVACDS